MLAAGIIFFMMCLTFAHVLGRYVFLTPVPAAYEITQLVLGVSVFAGLPLVSARESHVTISLLDNIVFGSSKWIQSVGVNLFGACVLGVLSWRLWVMGDGLAEYNNMSAFLRIPMAPLAYFMSVASGLTAVIQMALAWRYLRQRLAKSPARP